MPARHAEACATASVDNLAPFLLVVADERLVVQTIWLSGHWPHVGCEIKQRGKRLRVEVTQSGRKLHRRPPVAVAGQDKAPFAECRHVGVIGVSAEAVSYTHL